MRIHIDTEGLYFFLKFAGMIAVLLVVAYGGGQVVGTRVFAGVSATTTAAIDAQLEHIRHARSLASVHEAVTRGARLPLGTRTMAIPTIEDEVPAHGMFIGADLVAMKLSVYNEGAKVASYDILSKGKPGSAFETPSGLYSVRVKEAHHFSSIEHVDLPYAMQFYGNFFIHGWPVESDGTPVAEGYSGGCIRLSTPAAALLYNMVTPDTPLYVYDEPREELSAVTPITLESDTLPATSAHEFFLADLVTGEVYLEQNAHTKRPIASVTKLMTALVANETIAFDTYVPFVDNNQRYRIGDLFYPLFLRSDNDVANSIAQYYGWSNFMRQMNAKAKALGLYGTYFDDPSGLSPKNVSSASDLFSLGRYLYFKKRFLLGISKTEDKVIQAVSGQEWHMTNQNKFAFDGRFVGGKLGFTDEALQTSMGIFAVPVDDEMRLVSVVVLGSYDGKQDTQTLLSWFSRSAKLAKNLASASTSTAMVQ